MVEESGQASEVWTVRHLRRERGWLDAGFNELCTEASSKEVRTVSDGRERRYGGDRKGKSTSGKMREESVDTICN